MRKLALVVFMILAMATVGCVPHALEAPPPPDYQSALLTGSAWISEPVSEEAFKWEVRELAFREQYDDLEHLYTRFAAHPRYLVNGWTTRDGFLAAFDDLGDMDVDEVRRLGTRVGDWILTRPRSQVAPLVGAALAVGLALDTQSDEARLAQVRRMIQAARRADPSDVEPDVLELQFLARTRGDAQEAGNVFGRAVKLDPDCYALWNARLDFLLQEGASASDVLGFLEQADKTTRARMGDACYALLIWHFHKRLPLTFASGQLSWRRMREGFLDYGHLHPEATGILNAFAWMAHRCRDEGTARVVFSRIGTACDLGVWKSYRAFRTVRAASAHADPAFSPAHLWYRPALYPRPIRMAWLSTWEKRMELDLEIEDLLARHAYAILDGVAKQLRGAAGAQWGWGHTLTPSGAISAFYAAFALQSSGTKARRDRHLAELRTWLGADPHSLTARVALASALIQDGWRRRLSSDAGGQSEAPASFAARRSATAPAHPRARADFREASRVLREATVIGPDPFACYLQMVLARAEGRGQVRFATQYDAAVKRFPDFLALYSERMTELMPTWGGEPGSMEAFAASVATATRSRFGEGMYALLAATVWPGEVHTFLLDTSFDWSRIRQGIHDLISRGCTPNSRYWVALSQLAALERDPRTEAACLRAIPSPDLLDVALTPGEASYRIRALAGGSIDEAKPPLRATVYRAGQFNLDSFAPRFLEGSGTASTDAPEASPPSSTPLAKTAPIRPGASRQAGASAGSPNARHAHSVIRVPMRQGVVFGVVGVLNRLSRGAHTVVYRMRHPTFYPPGGGPDSESVYSEHVGEFDSRYLYHGLFRFTTSIPWEWVPGRYTASIWIDGRKVIRQRFVVYAP